MALSKKITLDNGIETNYHVIKEVHYNFLENKTIVYIDSYVSENVRNNHKKVKETADSINKLSEQAIKAQNESNYELLESLNAKINDLMITYKDISDKNYVAGTTKVSLDYIPEDISLVGVYKELKKTDEFSKAKKV